MKKYLNKKYLKIIIPVIILVSVVSIILLINSQKEKSRENKRDDLLPDTNILFNSNVVGYNNSSNTISKNDVQDAIDELYEAVTSKCYVGYTKGNVTSSSYTCTKKSKSSVSTVFDSSNVSYDNSNGISSSNVQGAINDLIDEIGYCDNSYSKQNETSSGYDCIINTQPSTITLTETNVDVTYAGANGENEYSYDGDGTVSCLSDDTSKVTCSVDTTNNKIVVTPVAATTSAVTITVSASATSLYYAPADVTFTVNVAKATLTCPGTNTRTVTYSGSEYTHAGNSSSCPAGSTGSIARGTNAGTYYGNCTPDDNHQFSSTCRCATLKINKKATTMSISPTSGSFIYRATSPTTISVTITTNGDGKLSCSRSGTGAKSCSISGKTMTITKGGSSSKTHGTGTVTVKQAAGTNYAAATNAVFNITLYDWYTSTIYNSASECASECGPFHSNTNNWSCTSSNTLTNYPSALHLQTGVYCWIRYE